MQAQMEHFATALEGMHDTVTSCQVVLQQLVDGTYVHTCVCLCVYVNVCLCVSFCVKRIVTHRYIIYFLYWIVHLLHLSFSLNRFFCFSIFHSHFSYHHPITLKFMFFRSSKAISKNSWASKGDFNNI